MEEITNRVQKHIDRACEVAENWMKEHLQMMLDSNNRINEIWVRMGTTAFALNGEPLWTHECEELNGYEEYRNFITKFHHLNLEGESIHLKQRREN